MWGYMVLNCIARSALTSWTPLTAPRFTLMSPRFPQATTRDAQGNRIHILCTIIRFKSLFYRCGGAVYEAEKVTIKDDPYHKKCLSCNKCGRQLDSLSLSIAPDNNVYCKVRSFHFSQIGNILQKFCIFPGMLQSCDSSWQASNLHGYGSNCRWRWERRMPSMQRKSFRGWKDDNQKWIVP